MKKILISFLMVLTAWMGIMVFSPTNVNAAAGGDCDAPFLTFRPWYYGLTDGPPDCNIKADFENENDFVKFVWTIVLNVLSDLFSAIGYLAIGFLIYGGYTYVLARGNSDKISKAKKIITSALVGLVICILASVIANTIVTIIIGATGA